MKNDVAQRRHAEASRKGVEVKRRALELGFDAVGIATLEANAHAAELDRWLTAGYAGTMTYLHRQAEKPAVSQRSSSAACARSEEHTSELQSLTNLVCRLLLEK